MNVFKKPEALKRQKVINKSQVNEHYNSRFESSVTSASPSKSVCSQESMCSSYSQASTLYKSVLSDCSVVNDCKVINNSSHLHETIKKNGRNAWTEALAVAKEWQICEMIEKSKKNKAMTVTAKGNLHKKIMTFECWWCILTRELNLCIQGSMENKNGVFQSEPIIKRMDSRTVASQNSLCKLKGNLNDHNCDLPHYIKLKFACGFPDDWKLVRKQWIRFMQEGQPSDFHWEENNVVALSNNGSTFCVFEEVTPILESDHETERDKKQKKNLKYPSLFSSNAVLKRISKDVPKYSLVERGIATNHQSTSSEQEEPMCSAKEYRTNDRLGTNFFPQQRLVTSDAAKTSAISQGPTHRFAVGVEDESTNANNCKLSTVSNIDKDRGRHAVEFGSETVENLHTKLNLFINNNKVSVVQEDDNSNDSSASEIDVELAKERVNCETVNNRKENDDASENLNDGNDKQVDCQTVNSGRLSAAVHINSASDSFNEADSVTPNMQVNCQIPRSKNMSAAVPITLEPRHTLQVDEDSHDINCCAPAADTRVQIEPKVKLRNIEEAMGFDIVLENWLPILQCKNGLCFKGTSLVGNTNMLCETKFVKARIKRDVVRLANGNTCKLLGPLTDPHNSLPTEIKLQFKNGVPVKWRMLFEQWKSKCKNIEADKCTAKQTREKASFCTREKKSVEVDSPSTSDQLCNQMSLKVSSRGRVLMKPLKHWLGETRASIIKSSSTMDIIKNNCNRQEESPAARSIGQKAGSSSNEKKCDSVDEMERLSQKLVKDKVNRKRKKESAYGAGKKSKKVDHESKQELVKALNSDAFSGKNSSDTELENKITRTISTARSLRSRTKDDINQKINFGNTLNINKNSGSKEKAVSIRKSSSDRTKCGEVMNLLSVSSGTSIPVRSIANYISNEDEGSKTRHFISAETQNKIPASERNTSKTKKVVKKSKKQKGISESKSDTALLDFEDLRGKPPRTLKQRKKLAHAIKVLSQKNKENVDLFDDEASESLEGDRAGWDDFFMLESDKNVSIGQETPKSKHLCGIYYKTPDSSPSTSIFAVTPCDKSDVLRYVHQQKTATSKVSSKTGPKRIKLPFLSAVAGNKANDVAYAALLSGKPIPKHVFRNELSNDCDESSSSELEDSD